MATRTAIKRPKVKGPTAEETQAIAIHAQKELATRYLHDFVQQAWPVLEADMQFSDNWHLGAICEHLQAVSAGQIENLLINVPPGTGKSMLTCVFWPCWEWASHPNIRWMFSSYSEEYAIRDSIKCRTLISSAWYQKRWPIKFAGDQNQKKKFQNIKGGLRICTGVGGATGEHPDRAVVDDPHKVNEAESDTERKAVIDWLDLVLSTRGILRNIRRVVIMQRLHAGDASGHLLDQGNWVHLCLPMRFEGPTTVTVDGLTTQEPRMKPTPLGFQDPRTEDGQLMWPERYTEQKVATMESKLGIYGTAGQLQQRPSPRGGGSFQRIWFKIVTEIPKLTKLVRYWDKAGTKGGTGAETSTTLMGEYRDETEVLDVRKTKFIILDVHAFRERAAMREALIKQTAETDLPLWGYVEYWVEQEPGSGGVESAEGTIANLVGFSCQKDKVTGSKVLRAEPLASQASVGMVCMLMGDWNKRFLEEIEMFPMGKLKDMVDSTSGAFSKLKAAGTGAIGPGDVAGMKSGGGTAVPPRLTVPRQWPGRPGRPGWPGR
jgi:predicted phage terminase large subunit-like protein